MNEKYVVVTDDWNGGCQIPGCNDTDSFRVLDTDEETLASPNMCEFHANEYVKWITEQRNDPNDLTARLDEYTLIANP